MNKEEFEKEAYTRGYNTKPLIKRWIELNPKEDYNEEDLKEVYYFNYLKTDEGMRRVVNRDGSSSLTTKKYQYEERHL
ncbi:Uncharacterised protein [Anaerococcus prevotii]|uniref:Uncharacterized protein n=1 Tax=Anaerococcus prevotii (strain ATCC 9321 / DSM 20548 / JCM 6508 / NCTC 11806 / PC1) TaxID=525919 RepID=C7RH91_ANAPD|nr:hypothetical protein [Anaerococcus prevotii]ACV28852.1 hypothetical protein Apre_0824 [Anaerococcus prevotii DSM 20548]SUU94526.1 Uncharacterised protein [Anaerococcus prevotii]